MRLTKQQSYVLAAGIVVTFFLSATLLLRSEHQTITVTPQPTQTHVAELTIPVATKASETPQGASLFALNEFHRSESKDGKKVWEVKAARGEYFPENNSAKIHAATLWFFRNEKDVVELHADHATLFLDGAALKRAEAFDGVRLLYNNEVTVEAQRATYDKLNDTVVAPGPVRILSDTLDVSGKDMLVKLSEKVVTISSEVESVVKPKKKQ